MEETEEMEIALADSAALTAALEAWYLEVVVDGGNARVREAERR